MWNASHKNVCLGAPICRTYSSASKVLYILNDQTKSYCHPDLCHHRYKWKTLVTFKISRMHMVLTTELSPFFVFSRLECKKLLSTTRLNALNASFYMTTIPLVSLAMFVSYALSGNTLTTEKVFTVVALVSSVSTIFSKIVPRGITLLKESGVSLKRIKVENI